MADHGASGICDVAGSCSRMRTRGALAYVRVVAGRPHWLQVPLQLSPACGRKDPRISAVLAAVSRHAGLPYETCRRPDVPVRPKRTQVFHRRTERTIAIDPRRLRITLDVEFDVTQSRRHRGQRVKDAPAKPLASAKRARAAARYGVEPKVQASAGWMYLWNEWDPSD